MNNKIEFVHQQFMEISKKRFSQSSFNTWIATLKIMSIDNEVVSIITHSTVQVNYIKGQYQESIIEILEDILDQKNIQIKYLVDADYYKEERDNTENFQINKPQEDLNISASNYQKTQLNPKFTFNNFIQGNGNETAYASSYQVAKNLKNTPYNPLLIFGGVGLGKTHLVQAVGNYLFELNPDQNILYIPSDQFVTKIVNSIKNNTIDQYKNSLRDKKLIIIDDIQFFAKKEKSQEELFHIFNYIYNNNGQIILTSDAHPNDIHKLDDRLKSRFKQGLVTDVRPPDLETRAAIISLKAEELNFSIDNDIIMFIANNINTNVRDLEGAVKKLAFYHSFRDKPLTINKTKELLKELIVSKKTTLNIDKIQDIVSQYYNIPKDLLLEKTRAQEVARPRAIAMYLCTTQLKSTTQSIGNHFGGRGHSTVSHAAKRVQTWLNKKDAETHKEIEEILNIINLSTY